MEKVNSLQEAQEHFLNHEGQVPSVICVNNGEEKEVTSLAEAEAFFAVSSQGEDSEKHDSDSDAEDSKDEKEEAESVE